MNNKFEQFLKNAKHIALSKEEKDLMRSRLQGFMRGSSAVREGAHSRLLSIESKKSILHILLKPMPVLAVLVALTLAGGGVSAAAEASLPGDILYPVKVKGVEEVRALLTLTSEAKAEWEARRIERRLEEAEKLASREELDAEKKARIEANFEAHAERVNKRIAEFKEKSDFEAAANVSSRLETSLEAHERILERLAVEKIKMKGEVSEIKEKAKEAAKEAMKHREEAESKFREEKSERAQEAAEGKRNAAKNKIEEVKKFIERIKEKLGVTGTAESEAKVRVAEQIFAEGSAKLEAEAYGEAFNLFQKALRTAEEAKLLAAAKVDFLIDLRLNGKEKENNSTSSENRRDAEKREEKKNNEGSSDDEKENGDEGEEVDVDIDGSVEIEVEL